MQANDAFATIQNFNTYDLELPITTTVTEKVFLAVIPGDTGPEKVTEDHQVVRPERYIHIPGIDDPETPGAHTKTRISEAEYKNLMAQKSFRTMLHAQGSGLTILVHGEARLDEEAAHTSA